MNIARASANLAETSKNTKLSVNQLVLRSGRSMQKRLILIQTNKKKVVSNQHVPFQVQPDDRIMLSIDVSEDEFEFSDDGSMGEGYEEHNTHQGDMESDQEDCTGICQTRVNYIRQPIRDMGDQGDQIMEDYDSIDIADVEASDGLQNKIQTLKSDPQYKQILAKLVKDSIQSKEKNTPRETRRKSSKELGNRNINLHVDNGTKGKGKVLNSVYSCIKEKCRS